MKAIIVLFFFFSNLAIAQQSVVHRVAVITPALKFAECSTADNENYLTEEEKQLFYWLNLARTQPKFFADSILKTYTGPVGFKYNGKSKYVASLYTTLINMQPQGLLHPNKQLYSSVKCFAVESGKKGLIGHERGATSCKEEYRGECCAYGYDKAKDIILQLLIDEGIADLGHRKIMLGNFTQMAVSIQPHKTYRWNSVLNFL